MAETGWRNKAVAVGDGVPDGFLASCAQEQNFKCAMPWLGERG